MWPQNQSRDRILFPHGFSVPFSSSHPRMMFALRSLPAPYWLKSCSTKRGWLRSSGACQTGIRAVYGWNWRGLGGHHIQFSQDEAWLKSCVANNLGSRPCPRVSGSLLIKWNDCHPSRVRVRAQRWGVRVHTPLPNTRLFCFPDSVPDAIEVGACKWPVCTGDGGQAGLNCALPRSTIKLD